MRRLLGVLVAVSFAGSAHAAEINVNTIMTNLDGSPAIECTKPALDGGKCEKLEELKVGSLLITALASRFDDERTLSAKEQVTRGALAMRIHEVMKKDGKIELDAQQIEMIKSLVAKLGYRTTAVVQIWQLLDPASVK